MAKRTESVDVDEPAMLFRIPQLYHQGMSDEELYEATRGHWRVGTRRERAELAFAIAEGVVLEVYRIDRWQPAGTASYATRPEREDPEGRWEFVGVPAGPDIRTKYVGRSVKGYFSHGNQNPIRYVNCAA